MPLVEKDERIFQRSLCVASGSGGLPTGKTNSRHLRSLFDRVSSSLAAKVFRRLMVAPFLRKKCLSGYLTEYSAYFAINLLQGNFFILEWVSVML